MRDSFLFLQFWLESALPVNKNSELSRKMVSHPYLSKGSLWRKLNLRNFPSSCFPRRKLPPSSHPSHGRSLLPQTDQVPLSATCEFADIMQGNDVSFSQQITMLKITCSYFFLMYIMYTFYLYFQKLETSGILSYCR